MIKKLKYPASWSSATLEELLVYVLGGDWGKDGTFDDPDYINVLCIRASELRHWDEERGQTAALRKVKKSSLEKRELREGDIILEISGGGPEQPVGRTVLIDRTVLSKKPEYKKICTNFFRLIRPSSEVNSRYLNLYLQSFYKSGKISEYQAGSNNLRNLKFNDYAQIEVPIAPLNEQKRIIAKIEELFSELDNGIAALKTAREQLKVYRQAILKHAFEGKLTAKWREEHAVKLETPEQLLARIQEERDARYQQQLKEWKIAVNEWETKGKEGKKPRKPKLPTKSRIIHNEYLPKLPEGWFWFDLASIMETVQIGPFGSLLHKADYVANAIPLINPSHIKNHKIVPDWNLTITEEKLSELTKYIMHENDIVIGRRGEMGRCAVVTAIESGWLCGTGSLFARPLDIANPKFYSLIISSQRVRDFLSNSSIGTTMQNLNEKILNGTPIPVCTRAEQDEIISQLSSQYSVIEQMEKTIDQEIKREETLRQSILKKAFSGELVPQDSKDEPASKLLDRIKAIKLSGYGK
ncbi:restriction endonuclease subunit S [Legionella pneumophila serogroup 1]|nr:restriction endonuclease [Legionella pneumophila]HAT7746847.1 restriction endonuclease [Legionella pneumophila]HAT7759322.1 restriction endonuclease [Legionella pneumophila]HAU2065271.1 restriction endonuclease [Legionella pneumophila]